MKNADVSDNREVHQQGRQQRPGKAGGVSAKNVYLHSDTGLLKFICLGEWSVMRKLMDKYASQRKPGSRNVLERAAYPWGIPAFAGMTRYWFDASREQA